MNDKQIRDSLIEYLKNNYIDARIYEERGIGNAICDVMVVDDCLIGFEIKSDQDNYERLEGQIRAYTSFFDENYIVVGKTHSASIEMKIPPSWGIIIVGGESVILRRKAKRICAERRKQLSLLWTIELKNILIKNNLPSCAQKNNEYIIDKIIECVDEKLLGKQIVEELKSRDYSLLDESELVIDKGNKKLKDIAGLPIQTLVEALSEQNFDEFSLADWMSLYRKGKEIHNKKAEKVVYQERNFEHFIPYTDITVALGVPWISREIIKDFVSYLLKPPKGMPNFQVNYEPITGNWAITQKNMIAWQNRETDSKYGVKRYSAAAIIEASLNLREIKVYHDGTGKLDREATVEALEKQQLIQEEFASWIWKDEYRRCEVERAYNEMFEGFGNKTYDGSKLTFPDSNPDIELFPYQKDAVQKIISTPNTLLSFDVGAGKTYIMIAAAMEMRRMGISRKNLFVVPNNIVGQWEKMFINLYPKAKVLAIEPKNFRPQMRQKVLMQMRDGDYDGIIIAYSCFEMIGFSSEYAANYIKNQLEVIKERIDGLAKESIQSGYNWNNYFQRNKLGKEKENISKMLSRAFEGCTYIEDGVTFDQMEINTLFLDEAHNYKNLPIKTHLTRIRGINTKGSAKCQDMLLKVRYVQNSNNGRGVVFATGTPLSNSISDAFVMQTYLQEKDMQQLRIANFDDWVKTFAKPQTVFELDVTTANYRMVERFCSFHNLPELSRMFSSISIFHAMADSSELPDFEQYTSVITKRSPALDEYMQEIVERTEKIRNRDVHPSKDNMLKVSTDGRKAALDLTLVQREQPYDETSKIVRCVENVLDLYNRFEKCSQLVFCDYSTPKKGAFDVYNEIKKRLIENGIPKKEIAFVHTCRDEFAKIELYEKVNKGEVRVLLGSTFKLGIGANVQSKLKAIHHLDVPWRPADLVQREGRILRRGNENKEVFIYRYIAEGSFDSYSWQILETKQNFITEFLKGSTYQRSASDLDDNVLTYAEAKALALASPLLKTLAEKENEVRKYGILHGREKEEKARLKIEIVEIERQIEELDEKIVATEKNETWISKISLEDSREEIENFCKQLVLTDLSEPNKNIGEILGFIAYLPNKQNEKHPYYFLEREGVPYSIEAGENVRGNITRMGNFIKKFGNFQIAFRGEKSQLILRREQCENALLKPIQYLEEWTKAKKERDEIKQQISREMCKGGSKMK